LYRNLYLWITQSPSSPRRRGSGAKRPRTGMARNGALRTHPTKLKYVIKEIKMAKLAKKITERFSKKVGKFQNVLRIAKDRDVNESDTVSIVTDILAEVFGLLTE